MPDKIIIVRHAETKYNVDRRLQGWLNIPLNEAGREQAQKVAGRLKSENPAAVYSSDHSRAFTTAVHIASHHKLKPIPVPDLREDYLGIFEGWQWEVEKDEAKEKMWQDRHSARERGELHFTVGGCETLHHHALRVQKFFGRVEKFHPAGTVIVVSHGGTINRIMEHFAFKSIRDGYVGYKNTSVSVLVKAEPSYRLDIHNDITHLAQNHLA